MKDDTLEKAVTSIRNDNADPAALDAAMARTGEKIAALGANSALVDSAPSVLRGCADIQALLPAFHAGTLSPARALLVDDHTRSCVPCRRALKAVRSGAPIVSPAAATLTPSRRLSFPTLALAASFLVAAALGTFWLLRSPAGSGPVATVNVVDGLLLAPEAGKTLAAGAVLDGGKAVRTGRSGGTVLVLSDGSRVELAARSEVAITRGRGGTTIALSRGQVIVEAAKQRDGHLFVKTPDCLVSVTGTVFSVAQGAKGSRVSVLEGEVHVDSGREKKVLHGGDQTSTRVAESPVPLAEEFGWSRNRAAFLELAGEVARVNREMSTASASWTGRTSTQLLDAMPGGTVVFASVPNVSGTVASFYEKLAPRLAANPILASWWGEGPGAPARQAEVQRLFDALRTWGSYFGEEVVLGIGTTAEGRPGAPVVLTTVAKPGFREFLESELARTGRQTKVQIVENPSEIPAAHGEALLVWIHGDLVAAALDGSTLAGVQTATSATGGFRGSAFYTRLADAYREGVDLLLGADLHALLAQTAAETGGDQRAKDVLRATGLLDAEYFILKRRSTSEESSGRATLSFSADRRGMAAWLAAPAPMGALSFVSSSSSGALAFVTKEPALLVDDFFSVLSAGNPQFPARLASFENEHGLHIRADLAEALGGDIAIAVDGPILPTPAWKLVVEVYDAARLQATIARLVSLVDTAARKSGKPGVRLVSEATAGLTMHSLVIEGGASPLQYAFVDGYLVAAPQKALVLRAAEVHRTLDTLLTAPKLVALMPKDGPLDFSMLAYQDVGGILGSLARSVGAAPGSAASQLESSGASLAWAWAGPSSIVFGSSGAGLSDALSLVAASNAFEQNSGTRRRAQP